MGDLVYPPYTPQKAGKVIDVGLTIPHVNNRGIFPPGTTCDAVKVRYLNGKEEILPAHLNNYRRLVEETEKKASNHRAILERLEKL